MSFIQVKKCLTDPKQLAKLIVLVICMCVACYQVSECVNKLRHPPVSASYAFTVNNSMKYPAVTVCRNPPYKDVELQRFGFKNPNVQFSNAWFTFKYDTYTLQQFFNQATYTFSEIVPLYGLDGFDYNVEVKSFYILALGRCFTLTPKNLSSDWVDKGYSIVFKHTDTTQRYSQYGTALAGFHVYIHDQKDMFTANNQQIDGFMEYIYVEAGESYQVRITVREYDQLSTSDHECVVDSGYSRLKCQENCLNQLITKDVGCSAPWIRNITMNQCTTYNQTRDLIKFYPTNVYPTGPSEIYYNACDCGRACNLTIYSAAIQAQKSIDMPKSYIRIYFSSNIFTVMSEVLGYDWSLFLSDLGASLGFFLGLSVLSALGLVEQVINVITIIRKPPKKEVNEPVYLNEKAFLEQEFTPDLMYNKY